MDLRPDNPCDRIGPVLGARGEVVRHMRALPHGEVASAIEKVRASTSGPVVKLAFEFLVLTATRSGEVRGAVWTEIGPGRGRVDHPGLAHEGESRAPGPAQSSCAGDSRGGACARSRQPAGVSEPARKAARRHRIVQTTQDGEDCCRAARVPVEFSGLGRPKRRTIPRRSSRRPWPMWSGTRSRQPTCARTCSIGGAGS